jgi:hypothetical protein
VVPIRGVQDVYQALTDKETLDKILKQGLDEENQKNKDQLLSFFMSIKDDVRIDDLFYVIPDYQSSTTGSTVTGGLMDKVQFIDLSPDAIFLALFDL